MTLNAAVVAVMAFVLAAPALAAPAEHKRTNLRGSGSVGGSFNRWMGRRITEVRVLCTSLDSVRENTKWSLVDRHYTEVEQ